MRVISGRPVVTLDCPRTRRGVGTPALEAGSSRILLFPESATQRFPEESNTKLLGTLSAFEG